jgi:hypothetical protein
LIEMIRYRIPSILRRPYGAGYEAGEQILLQLQSGFGSREGELEGLEALGGEGEGQAQGAFDGDLTEAEIVVVEDLAVLALLEVAGDAGDFGDLIGVADFVALVAETLAHLAIEIDRVDELDLASALARLIVVCNSVVVSRRVLLGSHSPNPKRAHSPGTIGGP